MTYKTTELKEQEEKLYTREEINKLLGIGLSENDFKEMRKAISQYCYIRNCDDCLMSLKCPRGREVPGDNGCEDWDEAELIEAYRCIEGVL